MDSLLVTIDEIWKSPTSEIFSITYRDSIRGPGREGWTITRLERIEDGKLRHTENAGTILAFEETFERTTIHFLDGCSYYGEHSQGSSYSDKPLGISYMKQDEIGESFILLAKEISNRISTEGKEGLGNFSNNQLPQEPKTRNLKDWFDYLHAVKHKTRIKLAYIAEKTGYALSTVKKEHSYYMKENSLRK